MILSRNNPLEIVCGKCGKNKEQLVNPLAYYYGVSPFWCENCLENDNADEEEYYEPEIFLPICNSPRMGVCGYEGSRVYPDQFESDNERDVRAVEAVKAAYIEYANGERKYAK